MPLESGPPVVMIRESTESLPHNSVPEAPVLADPSCHWVVATIPEDPTWKSSSARLQEPVGKDAVKMGSEVLTFLPKQGYFQLGSIQWSGLQPVSTNRQCNWGKSKLQQGAPKPGFAAKPSVSRNYIVISQVLAKLQDNGATKVKMFQTTTKKNVYWKQWVFTCTYNTHTHIPVS